MTKWMFAKFLVPACLLAGGGVEPAMAQLGQGPARATNAAEQLRCLEDKLSEPRLAAVAALFAQQPADTKDAVRAAHGSANGAYDYNLAHTACASRFGWTMAQQDAATDYLMRAGDLAAIRMDHGRSWNDALERFAPFAVAYFKADDKPSSHARAMILAGAMANSNGAVAPSDGDAVVAYVVAWRKREAARAVFAAARGA